MGKSITTADILLLENESFFLKLFQELLGNIKLFATAAEFSKYGSFKLCSFQDTSRSVQGVLGDLLSETSDGNYFIQRYVAYFCSEVLIKLPLDSFKKLTEKGSSKTTMLEDIMVKKVLAVAKEDFRVAEDDVVFMSKFQNFLFNQNNFPLKIPVVYAKFITFNEKLIEKLYGGGLRKVW